MDVGSVMRECMEMVWLKERRLKQRAREKGEEHDDRIKAGLLDDCIADPFKYYRTVAIPKRGGKGFRILNIPGEPLRSFQQAILANLLYKMEVSEAAHCGVPGRSIMTNVHEHRYSSFFLRTDFKDAFPSVTKGMVLRVLMGQLERLGAGGVENWANVLTRIVTIDRGLPQGAPTSPFMLNLACRGLDEDILDFLRGRRTSYSRYADDITISSWYEISEKERERIFGTIRKHGFKPHRQKTTYRSGSAIAPRITGIVLKPSLEEYLSRETTIPRAEVERYRAIIHQDTLDPEADDSRVNGIIAWSRMVLGEIHPRLKKPLMRFRRSRMTQYQPSLFDTQDQDDGWFEQVVKEVCEGELMV